jgi:hypothetical protein
MTVPLCAWSSSAYGTSVAPLHGHRALAPTLFDIAMLYSFVTGTDT